MNTPERSTLDLVCLSHLRWGFVYQRPQHLMSRFAKERRVLFFEEPMPHDGPRPVLDVQQCPKTGVLIAIPKLPDGLSHQQRVDAQRELLDQFLRAHNVQNFVLWYYTPMALEFSRHLQPRRVAFDVMDELSLFKGAPANLLDLESELFRKADVVFTGGQSLFEAKQNRHQNVHCFPSSVDAAHFRRARTHDPQPDDQANIGRPRIGYCGVIDERLDAELLARAAELRPDWQWIMVGPVVKIDPNSLPKRQNIHWLGGKQYDQLPEYMAGWDVAMMPFARNDSTRFISPTKTPEYLAAGLPVVSTSIRDVVRPYGENGMACIADEPQAFVSCVEQLMQQPKESRWVAIDRMLADNSWDATWRSIRDLLIGDAETETPGGEALSVSAATGPEPTKR